MPKTLLMVVGPTAVGKTAFAIQAAQRFGTEIVSADSRQFYSELNIGVARPSPQELASAPHHLVACRSILQPYNAYTFEHDALQCLDAIFHRHNVAVAVGGSGLYVDALCSGIALLPDPTPQLRQQLQQQIASQELEPLRRQLQQLDPEAYARIDLNNPVRVQRALEVCLTAGRPYSQLLQAPPAPRPFHVVRIAVQAPREQLRQRINSRVDAMFQAGLVDEVQSLLPHRSLTPLHTVGYTEIFAYLDGQCTLAQAADAIKLNTWHYAKKQITWLKRYPATRCTELENSAAFLQEIAAEVY